MIPTSLYNRENIPHFLSETEKKEIDQRILSVFKKHIRIETDFCGNLYAFGLKTAKQKFYQAKEAHSYSEESLLSHLQDLTRKRIKNEMLPVQNEPPLLEAESPEKDLLPSSLRRSFSKWVKIQQDFCGNFYATGDNSALNDFYKRKSNKYCSKEFARSELVKITRKEIDLKKKAMPKLNDGALIEERREVPSRLDLIRYGGCKRKTDSSESAPPNKRIYPCKAWTKEEDALLIEVIEEFQVSNPVTPVWEKTWSKEDRTTWAEISEIYQREALTLDYKLMLPANIKRRWQEALCPFIINGAINKNATHTLQITNFYNEATGSLVDRCKAIAQRFYFEQGDGRYYPEHKIRNFINYHLLKKLPDSISENSNDEWIDGLCQDPSISPDLTLDETDDWADTICDAI